VRGVRGGGGTSVCCVQYLSLSVTIPPPLHALHRPRMLIRRWGATASTPPSRRCAIISQCMEAHCQPGAPPPSRQPQRSPPSRREMLDRLAAQVRPPPEAVARTGASARRRCPSLSMCIAARCQPGAPPPPRRPQRRRRPPPTLDRLPVAGPPATGRRSREQALHRRHVAPVGLRHGDGLVKPCWYRVSVTPGSLGPAEISVSA